MDLDGYDRVIASLYDAGQGAGSLAAMFEAVRDVLQAGSTGISIYDEADRVITHTLAWPQRGTDFRIVDEVRALNDDAGLRLLTGARLRSPRRLSDIVPGARLRHAHWYRAQRAITGLGHGMVADVIAAGIRLRVFAMRSEDRADFTPQEVDLLGRIAAHLGRAFAGSLGLLAPRAVPPGLEVLIYDPDQLAPPFGMVDERVRLARLYGLTAAEARVLTVMVAGASRRDGAETLGMGINSLKSHMRRIYAKTGARRLPELMLLMRDPDQIVKPPSTGSATP